MIVELFIVGQALSNFMRSTSGVSPRRPFGTASTTSQECPRPATPPSAVIDIPFEQVSVFHDLGLLIPTTAADQAVVTPRPITLDATLTSAEAALAYTSAATGVPEDMSVRIATGRL